MKKSNSIVPKKSEIQKLQTQDKVDWILDYLQSPLPVKGSPVNRLREDWFTHTELYRLGLRRKGEDR